MSNSNAGADECSPLFCPITHGPILGMAAITAAGQVYEAAAIQKWLAHNHKDPVTNVELWTKHLVMATPDADQANVRQLVKNVREGAFPFMMLQKEQHTPALPAWTRIRDFLKKDWATTARPPWVGAYLRDALAAVFASDDPAPVAIVACQAWVLASEVPEWVPRPLTAGDLHALYGSLSDVDCQALVHGLVDCCRGSAALFEFFAVVVSRSARRPGALPPSCMHGALDVMAWSRPACGAALGSSMVEMVSAAVAACKRGCESYGEDASEVFVAACNLLIEFAACNTKGAAELLVFVAKNGAVDLDAVCYLLVRLGPAGLRSVMDRLGRPFLDHLVSKMAASLVHCGPDPVVVAFRRIIVSTDRWTADVPALVESATAPLWRVHGPGAIKTLYTLTQGEGCTRGFHTAIAHQMIYFAPAVLHECREPGQTFHPDVFHDGQCLLRTLLESPVVSVEDKTKLALAVSEASRYKDMCRECGVHAEKVAAAWAGIRAASRKRARCSTDFE